MYKLSFYVPESHLETTKQALFAIGVGRYENYDCCCWQTAGIGQYRPLQNSNPYHGDVDEIAKAPEFLVEMICDDSLIKQAIIALKNAHPYETPAYSAWQIELFNE